MQPLNDMVSQQCSNWTVERAAHLVQSSVQLKTEKTYQLEFTTDRIIEAGRHVPISVFEGTCHDLSHNQLPAPVHISEFGLITLVRQPRQVTT